MNYFISKSTNTLFLLKCIFLLVCLNTDLIAKVTVAKIFSDNMVLQRDMPVPVWGWADEKETITVSFNEQTKTTIADKNGKWQLKMDPLKACKTPKQMTISGKNRLIIKNILVGEVWICSGQSNMQMRLQFVLQAKEELITCTYPQIRLMEVPRVRNNFLVTDIPVKWRECNYNNVIYFSATAYFFARNLYKELDVPIGLISTNWGGTQIEPWISPEGYRLVPELKTISNAIDFWLPTTEVGNKNCRQFLNKIKSWMEIADRAVTEKKEMPPRPNYPMELDRRPTQLYNSMIHPLIPYAIRGALWYQGESNGGEGISYFNKMQALIGGWRQLWNQGDFPFYFVQLAGWKNSNPNNPAGGDGWARIREAQRKSLKIPNTGMAVTIDIGDAKDIHPKNKQDVGKRLALWALAKDYKKDVVFSGPLYKDMKIEGDKIRVSFNNTGSGLMIAKKTGLEPVNKVKDGKIKYISIQGKDKKWHWANLVIDGHSIIISSDQVKEPIAVRYCYTMNPTGALLYNKEGLPASPFTTEKLR